MRRTNRFQAEVLKNNNLTDMKHLYRDVNDLRNLACKNGFEMQCELATKQFSNTRLQNLFMRSDQQETTELNTTEKL